VDKRISLKELAEFFLAFEEKYNLLSYEIDGVKIWLYLRFRIFQTVARQAGLFQQAHTKHVNFKEIVNAVPSLFYYSVFSNPLSGNYKKKYLIFSSGRKVKEKDKYIDIYTEYFVRDLKEGTYEIIEELYLNKHFPGERKNRKHQDYQQIRTFLKTKFSKYKFRNYHHGFISTIQNEIKLGLNIEIDLFKLFRNGFLNFKYDFEFYNKLIKKREPEKIYLICSYGYKMALVAAAKKNGVEVIELQHGTMSKYHFGYSYPGKTSIGYFPDKILFLGDYWKNCMHYPLTEEKKEVYGFPVFRKQREDLKLVSKIPNQVLVISQGTIANKLSEFIWKNKEVLKSYSIIYKLHPGEYDRWNVENEHLKKLALLDNVTVIDSNKYSLYELFAESEFVIGVYSTAIFEALSFKCNVLAINLEGIDYIEDLVERKMVKLISNKNELKNELKTYEPPTFDSDYFFK
jgi:hypothetical protein